MTRRKFATGPSIFTTDDGDVEMTTDYRHWLAGFDGRMNGMEEEQVVVTTISPGDGIHYPGLGDIVTLHYQKVNPTTDEIIESSRLDDNGEPIVFVIGDWQTDPGWDDAVMLMSHGETAKIQIPCTIQHGKVTDDDTVMLVELIQLNGEDFDPNTRDMSKVQQTTKTAKVFRPLSG